MRTSLRRDALAIAMFSLLAAPMATAQTPGPEVPPPTTEPQDLPLAPTLAPTLAQDTSAALQRLAENLSQARSELETAVQQGDTTRTTALREQIQQLRWQFARLATHINVQEFDQPSQRKFELEAEVLKLIRPLVQVVNDATKGPREGAALAARLEAVKERRRIAQTASANTRQTRDALPADSPAHREAQRELDEHWLPLLRSLGDQILVLDASHRHYVESQEPLLTRATRTAQLFLQKSGLNVLIAVLVFVVIFFGLRFVSDRLLRGRRHRGFSVRLAEVLLRVVVLLVAIAAMMAVPYARDDWLLISIGLIFLVGSGWVLVKMAPQFFEQIRLILNVGAVREGERVLIGGLPYRVEALRFYCKLNNPNLSGGTLRLPVKDLIEMRSRPCGNAEPWFPCKQGEVVALSDGVIGQVQLQTPEVVIVVERHDAPRSYATTTFLDMNPRNLSHGFEIVVTFGIDYAHQKQAATVVPQTLEAAVRAGLAAHPDSHEVRNVRVELEAAGSSSLDFAVLAEFGGGAAIHYHDLHRLVNTLLVTACSEHGFGIPFPQLQVHGVKPA